MSWWGAIIGGTFGFMLGGPIGALLGATLGQTFGRAVSNATIETGTGTENLLHDRAELAFLTATFGVMGHVAKADGRVSPCEIQLANYVMQMFQLNTEQRKAARAIFNEGKKPNFPLADVLTQLRTECNRSSNLPRMFLEIQVQTAWIDVSMHGAMGTKKHHLPQTVDAYPHPQIQKDFPTWNDIAPYLPEPPIVCGYNRTPFANVRSNYECTKPPMHTLAVQNCASPFNVGVGSQAGG